MKSQWEELGVGSGERRGKDWKKKAYFFFSAGLDAQPECNFFFLRPNCADEGLC